MCQHSRVAEKGILSSPLSYPLPILHKVMAFSLLFIEFSCSVTWRYKWDLFSCGFQVCAFFFGFFEVLDVGSGLGQILYRSAGLRAYGADSPDFYLARLLDITWDRTYQHLSHSNDRRIGSCQAAYQNQKVTRSTIKGEDFWERDWTRAKTGRLELMRTG